MDFLLFMKWLREKIREVKKRNNKYDENLDQIQSNIQ